MNYGDSMQNASTEKTCTNSKSLKKYLAAGVFCLAAPFALSGCGAVLLAGAAAGGTAAVQSDERNVYSMAYDESIEQNSYKIIKTNTLLTKPEDFRITVTSFNGNVLITGQTINKDYIKWCVKQIEKLEHVRKVYNYATLQKPVPASVISSDSYITSKVKTQLLFGKDINSNRFKVVTENGNVYLMGIVTNDESNRAINTVLAISGVRKVYHIFDYMEKKIYKGNEGRSNDRYSVTPEKGPQSSYVAPQRNSSYVPPVQNQQNGGAYIVEDVPMDNGPSSLLAPSDNY